MRHLKDLSEEKREELSPYEIDACINQFRHRLHKVIEVVGKHILNNFSRIAVLRSCVIVDYHDMFKSFVVIVKS